jgi:four helix bundle protein
MGKITRFEDIESWKAAREVTNLIYSSSRGEKFSRDFALCNQIRRAAISIVSNIAEGFERDGNKEFLQFLSIAKGSCGEVRAQLYIALDQEYLDKATFDQISTKLVSTSRLINGFMKYLRESEMRGSKFQ